MLEDIMARQKYLNRSGAIEFLYDFYFATLKESGMKLLASEMQFELVHEPIPGSVEMPGREFDVEGKTVIVK